MGKTVPDFPDVMQVISGLIGIETKRKTDLYLSIKIAKWRVLSCPLNRFSLTSEFV